MKAILYDVGPGGAAGKRPSVGIMHACMLASSDSLVRGFNYKSSPLNLSLFIVLRRCILSISCTCIYIYVIDVFFPFRFVLPLIDLTPFDCLCLILSTYLPISINWLEMPNIRKKGFKFQTLSHLRGRGTRSMFRLSEYSEWERQTAHQPARGVFWDVQTKTYKLLLHACGEPWSGAGTVTEPYYKTTRAKPINRYR